MIIRVLGDTSGILIMTVLNYINKDWTWIHVCLSDSSPGFVNFFVLTLVKVLKICKKLINKFQITKEIKIWS